MPLPESGTVAVQGGSIDPKPAHLIKIPDYLIEQLDEMACSGERFMISMDGGPTLVFANGDRVPLQAQTIGNPTEIHHLNSAGALEPIALASARLSVPFTASTSAKAAQRLREQTEARDREKKANADRINGVAKPRVSTLPPAITAFASSMARTQSSPAVTAGPPTPVIPLKTKVIQHLALGPCPQADIVQRLRQPEDDIMRVVNVVGRRTSAKIPTFELQPVQYAKIKIPDWSYSSSELRTVCALARKAFDELKLPPDADERVELDRKEAAAAPSRSKSNSISPTGSGIIPLKPMAPGMHPLPAKPVASAVVPNSRAQSRPGSQTSSSRPGSTPQSRTGSHSVSPPINQTAQVAPSATVPAADVKHVSANAKRGTDYKIPKKEQGQKSLFTKQFDKYKAEKRAASMPSRRSENGATPPRITSAQASTSSRAIPSSSNTSRDRSNSDEKKHTIKPSRVNKRTQTPSESSDEESERPRKLTAAERRKASKLPSPDYSSSTDEDAHRGRPAKRSTPPPAKPSQSTPLGSSPLTPASMSTSSNVNGRGHIYANGGANGNITHSSPSSSLPPKSHDEMRERYEELYPAYDLLTRRLTAIYQECEDVEVSGRLSVSKEEVDKLAARWQRWHAEIESIKQWFD